MQKQILLDTRPDSYGSFFTDDFGQVALDASEDVEALHQIVFDLVADWRAASYSGALPSVIPSSVKSFHDAYLNEDEPNTGTLRFANAILRRMAQLLPEVSADPALQRRLHTAIVRVAADIKEISGGIRIEMSIEDLWAQYLSLVPFQLGLVGTMRLVLVSVYSAYENFVVRALSLAHGGKHFRVTRGEKFASAFRDAFGDLYDRGWREPRIHAYRLVRNAFLHTGGRVTEELKAVRIPVVTLNDTLHVYPEHIKELYNLLKLPALELVRSSRFRQRAKKTVAGGTP